MFRAENTPGQAGQDSMMSLSGDEEDEGDEGNTTADGSVRLRSAEVPRVKSLKSQASSQGSNESRPKSTGKSKQVGDSK